MSEPYLGEIRMFGGSFAPRDWMLCNGQLLSIAQYSALYSLIGTTYGGDGTTNFALPDLQSRVAIGQGNGTDLTPRTIGEAGGQEHVTLTIQQVPSHVHALNATTAVAAEGGQTPGSNFVLAQPSGTGELFTVNDGTQPPPTSLTLPAQSCSMAGSNMPHDNIMPILCVNYIIAVTGIFPSRN